MNDLQLITKDKLEILDAIAENVLKSQIVPSGLNSKEKIKIVMLTGAELGMKPMESLTNLFVVNGRCSMMAQNMISLIRKGLPSSSIKKVHSDHLKCEISASRDGKEFETFTFTAEDAKRAGLMGKEIWQKYTQDMLWARTVSRMARRLFPDLLAGATYTPEELDPNISVSQDGTPISSYTGSGGGGQTERAVGLNQTLENAKDVTPAPKTDKVETVSESPLASAPPKPRQSKPKAEKVAALKVEAPVAVAPKVVEPEPARATDEQDFDQFNGWPDGEPQSHPEDAHDYGKYMLQSGGKAGKTLEELGRAEVQRIAQVTIDKMAKMKKEDIKQSTIEFLHAAEMWLEIQE